ncbi:hypothetical protein ACOSQ4_005660 [Xanthoceras sorbifolium]
MGSVNLSIHFLGTQVEFGVASPEKYTLAALWANVYMFSCSTIPDPSETFKAEVKLPWTRQYKHLKDDCDLQEVLKICIDKGIHTIRINVDLLPVQLLPQAEVHLTQPSAESSSSSINGTLLPNCSDELIFIFSEDEDSDGVTQNDYDAEISCEDEDYNPCEDDSESGDENDSVESLWAADLNRDDANIGDNVPPLNTTNSDEDFEDD